MNHKLIKKPEVLELCPFSEPTLYRLIKKGAFPAPVSLTGGRAVAFVEAEVIEWIEERKKERLAKKD